MTEKSKVKKKDKDIEFIKAYIEKVQARNRAIITVAKEIVFVFIVIGWIVLPTIGLIFYTERFHLLLEYLGFGFYIVGGVLGLVYLSTIILGKGK